jgi:pyruvate formate lyase activating enzyme
MKEALLYHRLNGRVQCEVCQRRCIVNEGRRGFCRTRLNKGGRLYSLTYGRVASLSINPIEKKPVFHFYPGSRWLSLGSLGCNFLCPGCQNWEIAHSRVDLMEEPTEFISPEKSVRLARERDCLGISWTFNEPTLWFEYTLEGARLAREEGLFTNYVTNGFMTGEALDEIGPYLDVFRVDIKGFSGETYHKVAHIKDLKGILGVTERAKGKWDMHVEVVTNVTPGFNDSEEELKGIASWIRDSLGRDTPWHVTRFYPHLHLSHLPPTPIPKLERAREIGLEAGLNYVYIGNVPGHPGENTCCPSCGRLLIERFIYEITFHETEGGRCLGCGYQLAGRFEKLSKANL